MIDVACGECDLMRILQILHDHERGGIRTLAGMIEAGLPPHRFTFETAYLFPRPGLSARSKLGCALRMALRIWRGEFDALIAYQATAAILVGTVGRLRGCRLRIVHQTCPPGETAPPIRLIDKIVGTLGLYTANIANSAATWDEFARYPAAYRRAMILIEHGLVAPAPRRMREQARRRFDLPESSPMLLHVGRLDEQKKQDLLIRVVAGLPQAHLVLAGAGAKAAAYRSLAVALGVTDRVHMLGPLPEADIADLYAAADLFVFPSAWETFGLAAVEAAMVGVPMVVVDLPVLREVLRTDGSEPVVYVAGYDAARWTSAIRDALVAPPLPRIAAAFARAMRRKYSQQRMIESYLRLFEEQPTPGPQKVQRSGMQANRKEVRT